jgi:glycosyltransferase involved in cell wall biosynthesis
MKPKRIAVVSLSDGIWDPRVLRLSTTLANAGFQVSQYGFPTNELMPTVANWKYTEIKPDPIGISRKRLLLNRLVMIFGTKKAASSEWLLRILPKDLYAVLKNSNAEIFIAMDYTLLPSLFKITEFNGGNVCYEAREYYQGQNHKSRLWRMYMPKIVREIEGKHINDCAIVTTVSNGISDLLYREYSMKVRPEVIYGFPEETTASVNMPKGTTCLVFHGNLSADREIDRFIRFFDFEKSNVDLVIRGNGSQDYIDLLRGIISSKGLNLRVKHEVAVSKIDLLAATSKNHFGLIPWRNRFPQKKYSMPNKFFEYLSAGLPVICTSGSELAEIVETHKIGLVFNYSEIDTLEVKLKLLDDNEYGIMQGNVQKYLSENGYLHQRTKVVSLYSKLDI